MSLEISNLYINTSSSINRLILVVIPIVVNGSSTSTVVVSIVASVKHCQYQRIYDGDNQESSG